jgi:hypothetical protein
MMVIGPNPACLACGHADRHASWCGHSYLAQDLITIGAAPARIPDHVGATPMLGAYRHADLKAAKRWQPPRVDVPPTTDEERAWVGERVIALAAERQARSDAHRKRILTTAAWLGSEVAAHKVTLADAQARIDRLLEALDPDTAAVRVLLVPFREARQLATDAFMSTFEGHAHG